MNGANILLFTESSNTEGFSRNLGTYRLATEVRKYGYTCQVIDFYTYYNLEEYKKIIDKYIGDDTIVVGFSLNYIFLKQPIDLEKIDNLSINKFVSGLDNTYIEKPPTYCGFSFKSFLKISSIIKRKNKKIKFVSNKSLFNKDLPFVDIIEGYADQTFLEYIKKHDTKKIGSYNEEKFDFTKSQILWHPEDHVFVNETLPIEISRGCVFRCKFCSAPMTGKRKNEYEKDPLTLKEEFEHNYELFKTTNYVFYDNIFNSSTNKLIKLYNECFSKLNFKINAITYCRLDLIYKQQQQLDLLSNIGAKYLKIGAESINDKSAKFIGKPLTFKKLKEITKIIKQDYKNLKTIGLFIFGLPYETPETLEYMYKWIMNEGLEYFDMILTQPFALITNTTIYKKYLNELGYYYDTYHFDWKNKSGTSYKMCLEYSDNVNSIIEQNNINRISYAVLNNEIFNETDVYNKPIENQIEYIISHYKQGII